MLDLNSILGEATQNKTTAADVLSQVNTFKMNTSYYTNFQKAIRILIETIFLV